jgi:hypothetical protein
MVDRDREKDQPSLELPKLGLRRRRRPAADPVPPPSLAPAVDETRPVVVEEPEAGPDPEPRRRAPRERRPGGMLAAVLIGAVVGLGLVGLTWASLRSCEGVRGTSSCGDAGYPLLGLMLVAMGAVGALLLRLLRVRDPATTSLLGLGLGVVVALLAPADHLLDGEMVVVIPVLCAAAYGLAHWVTRTFVEPPRD